MGGRVWDINATAAIVFSLAITESRHAEGCEEGAHAAVINFGCLALDLCTRARGARAGGTRGAFRGLRALHFWAARARARRAFTLRLSAFAAVKNDRALFRHGGLQHIIAQVGDGRAFRLQHVIAQIRAAWAWRDRRF